MAETILGKVCPTPRGAYNANIKYEKLDIIQHDGNGYMVLKECTGVLPSESEYYMLLSAKGSDGTNGTDGAAGTNGADGKSAYQAAVEAGYTGTEAEFGILMNSIQNKQDKLTGSAGQIVEFDSMGLPHAGHRWSNPNLLDNWYFAAPVNQRGQTEYTEPGYSIDRWTLQNITNAGLIVHDGYITLSAMSNDGLLQRFEPSRLILGAEYTMSVLTHDGQLLTSPFVLSNQGVIENYAGTEWSGFHGYDPDTSTFMFYPIIAYGKAAQISIDLVAAKLELGSVQTLARKEGDAWVLNDPPPNKALELEKCQRYFVALDIPVGHDVSTVVSNGNSICLFPVCLPVPMRANAACASAGALRIHDADGYTDVTPNSSVVMIGSIASLMVEAPKPNAIYSLDAGIGGAKIQMSADL